MIVIQYTFCQIQRISPQGPLAFHSVCVLKKKPGVHTQPWLCKRETNRIAWVEPPTQVIKYQCFSRVFTKHFGIICHNLCLYTEQTNANVSEGALKGGVYLFGCWVQISTSFLQNHRQHLSSLSWKQYIEYFTFKSL